MEHRRYIYIYSHNYEASHVSVFRSFLLIGIGYKNIYKSNCECKMTGFAEALKKLTLFHHKSVCLKHTHWHPICSANFY